MVFTRFFSKISFTIVLILISYLFFLPHYIQGGDSAELIASAYYNLVAHPPGYPLWLLLQQGWMKVVTINSLVWRASFLNVLFALTSLVFIIFPLKKRQVTLLSLALMIMLAFTWTFFQAAIIPDVFALHALFVSAVLWLSIDDQLNDNYRSFLIPFLFALSVSNHHTTIFLIPIVIERFLSAHSRKTFIKGAVAGCILTALLYATLMLRNPESPYSWGEVKDFSSLISHFLRSDYGTFRLAANDDSHFFNMLGIWKFLEINAVALFFGFIVFLLFVPLKKQLLLTRKNLTLVSTLILSLLFLGLVNFKIEGMAEEIVSRFHVMPLIVLIMTLVHLIASTQKVINRKSEYLVVILAVLISLPTLYKNLNLSKDNIIENYSHNLLKQAHHHEVNALLVDNDNSYFALRLLQLENADYQSIAVISPPLLFHSWYYLKQQHKLEHFKLLNEEKIFSELKMDFVEDLLKPNTAQYKSILTRHFQNSADFKLTFLPLGRIVEKGQGLNLNESLPATMTADISAQFDSLQGFSKKLLHAEYSHYYLAKGMMSFAQKQEADALVSWKKAIALVPYCLPAYQNICQITPQDSQYCSVEKLEEVKENAQLIF